LIVNYDAIYKVVFILPNKNKIFFYFFYVVLIKANAVLNYRRKKNYKKTPKIKIIGGYQTKQNVRVPKIK
jgi:hypothetical protein